jgi:rhodanese-related sulfurtransferase
MLPTISAEQLRRKLESGDDFVLVDALAPMVYAHSHLPRAINLPSSDVDPARVAKRIPDRSTEIVVYCSSPECEDSVVTGTRLRELGYVNVTHYSGGKDEWKALGLPLERAGKPYVPS